MNSNNNLKPNKMKKHFFMLIVTAIFTITNQSNAQNTFPASGNVGIGTNAPNHKLEVIGGNIGTDGAVYSNNWFRSYGNSGWYNETYDGGLYMADNTWIRTYGAKNILCDKAIRADDGFQVDGQQVIDGNGGWHRTYGDTGWYNGTYGGGWNMSDYTWIRSFGSKSVLCDKVIRADEGFQVNGMQVIDGNGGWHRSYGDTGWYNNTYGGGWNMSDNIWIRSFGSKSVYVDKTVRADDGFQVDGMQVIDGNGGWHRTYGDSGWYNETYKGGIYMTDNIWIRVYNNKAFYSSNTIRTDGELHVGESGNRMIVKGNGNVGIGSFNPDEKLTVKGKIHAEEVRIDLSIPADYVFEKYYNGNSSSKSDYIMPTLSEVEKFTKANNHLPDVPSAKEIKEKGLQVGEMTNILLQKIEEMTLYIIEQNKRIEALESKISTK